MKRKRTATLPRVTLMAFSRKDLLAFVESVEALRHLVADLRQIAADLAAAARTKTRRTPAAKPSNGESVWVEPIPPVGPDRKGVTT